MTLQNIYNEYRGLYKQLKSNGRFDKPLIGAEVLHLKEQYPEFMDCVTWIKNTYNLSRVTEALYWIDQELLSRPICQYQTPGKCKQTVNFINYFEGYRKGCKWCGRHNEENYKKRDDAIFAKFGVRNPAQVPELMEKRTQNAIEKQGGWGWSSQQFQEKFKQTMIEKYGVDNAVKNESLKNKMIESKLEFFNDPDKKKEYLDKKTKTEIERYGDIYVRTQENKHKNSLTQTMSLRYQKYIHDMLEGLSEFNLKLLEDITWEKDTYQCQCTRCGQMINDFSLTRFREGKRYWCTNCYKHSGNTSISEHEVGRFIQENVHGIDILHNCRNLIPNSNKELDLYFPEYRIGIEFCGMLYHATAPYGINGKGVPEDYHENKFYLFNDNNINIITLFEFEWMSMSNRKEIKKRLLEYFGIYDNHVVIDTIRNTFSDECTEFLHNNKNFCPFSYPKQGLYSNDELVAVIIENTIYKKNGIKIDNLNEFLLQNNFKTYIQDNRYPITFNNITKHHHSIQWQYHDGWCSKIYLDYPDKTLNNIRRINDCGYSLVTL